MIVEPLTLPPTRSSPTRSTLMERYHISGVPITDDDGRLVGILTNRDLRFEKDIDAAGLGADDLATTSSPRRSGRRSPRPRSCCTATGSRSCRSSTPTGVLKGLITVKDIQKRIEFPHVDQGPAGPAARRRGGRRRARRDRARPGADRGGRRRARRRHRARPLARRGRDGRADQGPLRRVRGGRRQHRDRRGGRGADRRGRRRGEGRDRARARSARPAIVAGVGVPQVTAIYDVAEVAAAPRRAGDRRRRHHLLGRRREGDRRRRGHA